MNTHEPSHAQHGDDRAADDGGEPDSVEPAVNPDSPEREREQMPEPAHPATHFDAGTGQGTVTGPPRDSPLQERPILDGSTQNYVAEATVPNPNRGESDPAQMKEQPALNSTNTNRWLFAAVIAATIMTIVLLLLMPWNPMWCGIGITVALVGVSRCSPFARAASVGRLGCGSMRCSSPSCGWCRWRSSSSCC